jgi:hypothetical protein
LPQGAKSLEEAKKWLKLQQKAKKTKQVAEIAVRSLEEAEK